MKVTVKTNCLSRNNKRMIEITFSNKPDLEVLSELKKKGWWWNGRNWSHFYSKYNENYALNLSHKMNGSGLEYKGYRNFKKSYRSYDDYETAFAYLRKKKPMAKKHDFGARTSGASMTSLYDCRSRMVVGIR